jgi:hypothetical protein
MLPLPIKFQLCDELMKNKLKIYALFLWHKLNVWLKKKNEKQCGNSKNQNLIISFKYINRYFQELFFTYV